MSLNKIVVNYRGTIIEGVITGSHVGAIVVLEISKDLIELYQKRGIIIPKSIKVQHVTEGFYREVS